MIQSGEEITQLTGVGRPTWELFVAYRQSDAPGHAGRIGERLIGYFGRGQVFKDIESLPFGVDSIDFIRDKLQRAFVMVVVIGLTSSRWRSSGSWRRGSLAHFGTALQRGTQIIPVFMDGATVPFVRKRRWVFRRKADLPEDIRAVVRKNGIEITNKRWDYDVGTLIQTVERALADSLRLKRFLAQVPPWDSKGGWQWIMDDPPPDDKPPKYE